MRISRQTKLLLLVLGAVSARVAAFAPTNFHPPYDPTVQLPPAPQSAPFRLGVNVEYGSTHDGRDWDGDKRNVLQLYDATQSTIAMLENAMPSLLTPDFIAVRDALRIVGARDDGTRGHITLHGDFEQVDVTPYAHYVFDQCFVHGDIGIGLALPIRYARIDDVHFEDLTSGQMCLDNTVRGLLTNSFDTLKGQTKNLGNLSLDNWSKGGVGDLLLTLDWRGNYPQCKEALKNVDLHAFIGLWFPTGLKKDEDRAFSFAFGNDGAWAMPFGIGIDLDFRYHIALGAEAQFEVVFDHTKVRRIKTQAYQTEFLLLNKARASKDYGFTWKFYLYAQAYHFWRGLSLKAAYEYVKHDSDHLNPRGNNFDAAIANTAHSLGEWNMHNIITQLNYDFFQETKCSRIKPQLSFFVKFPVTGKRVINPYTFGGVFAINF